MRTKNHVRASVVFPPVSGQYASLGVEPLKEGRARIWNQYIERCILNGHLLQISAPDDCAIWTETAFKIVASRSLRTNQLRSIIPLLGNNESRVDYIVERGYP